MTRERGSTLRREIRSQPAVLERILVRERGPAVRLSCAVRRLDPKVIMLVARGSADNAARYGQYVFGVLNHRIVALAAPSVLTRYRASVQLKDVLVVAISQSGESFDVVEVVEASRRAGALTVALTNSPSSPLARAADEVLLCHAGPERSVAATKTYTAQILLLALLSAALEGGQRRMSELERVPDHVAAALAVEPEVAEVAERLRYLEHCAVVGRGYCYGTAFEIALKLGELTYIVAQPYSSADFRHGPIAVVEPGFCVVLLAPTGRVLADVKLLLAELRSRSAEVIAFSDDRGVLRRATRGLPLPPGIPEWISPLACVVPGQLLAMHLCAAKGLPVDRPRHLAKVTRTR